MVEQLFEKIPKSERQNIKIKCPSCNKFTPRKSMNKGYAYYVCNDCLSIRKISAGNLIYLPQQVMNKYNLKIGSGLRLIQYEDHIRLEIMQKKKYENI